MEPLLIMHPLNGLLMIALPVALSIFINRKLHCSWRLWWIGAGTFILSQVGHIPFNSLFNQLLRSGTLSIPPDALTIPFQAITLGFSAGLWEEGARYLMYRWWAKDARSWKQGLMLGAGHGGIEAIILGLLVLVTFINLYSLRGTDLSKIVTADRLPLVLEQVNAYWSIPRYTVLIGALERALTLPFHLSCSIIVLQVFTRKQHRWLLLAILWHTIFDAGVVYAAQIWNIYIAETLLACFTLVSLGIIFVLRQEEPEKSELEPVRVKHVLSTITISPPQETIENLDETRFNPKVD